MLVFNLLCIYIAYSILSCKFTVGFSTFSIFILSGKKGKSFEDHVIFRDIEHQLEENILHHYPLCSFP